LSAYKLKQNWNASMRIITVVDESQVEKAHQYLENFLNATRLKDVIPHVEIGSFKEALQTSPQADVDLFGLPDNPDLDELRSYVELTRSACVFVIDSGNENVMA